VAIKAGKIYTEKENDPREERSEGIA
jgi:hypothetical protein